ncbi:glycosyltransferase [Roseomonas sp. WA12]
MVESFAYQESSSEQKAPLVSIVISTYNRARTLRRALSSLRFLRYPNFEVIVVNGPSTDNTSEVIEEFRQNISVLSTEQQNLSLSRNIGIANSSGEIIAFMDDDAIPEPDWLDELVKPFENNVVVAAGGFIRDHSGVRFQAKAVVSDRFGRGKAFASVDAAKHACSLDHNLFLSLTGTNSAIRRSALEEVAAFDETYEYFLDETDVNLKLVDAGGVLDINPHAEIHHKYAESHLRTVDNVPKRMFPIMRSVAYFAIRHGLPRHGWNSVVDRLKSLEQTEIFYKSGNLAAGQISGQQFSKLSLEIREGIRQGVVDGVNAAPTTWADKLAQLTRATRAAPFVVRRNAASRLRLCMLSQDEGSSAQGGIGRWSRLVARGLSDLGHEVTIMGRNARNAHTVDFTDTGYWSHRVPTNFRSFDPDGDVLDLPPSVGVYSQHMLAEFKRVNDRRRFNVVSSPIWDVEGAAFFSDREVLESSPVCLSLHTSVALALEFKPEWRANSEYLQNHVKPIMMAERLAIRKARTIIANSEAIVQDIERLYKIEIERDRLVVVPHGVDDIPNSLRVRQVRSGRNARVLFVGRLEFRKGADILAKVIDELCSFHPELEVDFVGSGADQEVVRLVQEIQGKYSGRVRHHGYVDDEDLLRFYSRADIFVAPSRYESFGLIFAEAMRFGLPCVGFRAGGVPEVVRHGETGLLAEIDDSKGLYDALDTLISDPDVSRALGDRGRDRFDAEFTVETMAKRLEEVYIDASLEVGRQRS